METLIDALKNDWQGHEALRADIRKNGRFFGNNDEHTDELVNRLIADLDALANKRAPLRGGRFLFGCYIGYNSAHISMGLRTGATPNGRRRGDALTAGIIAEPGMDKNGLTSYLASAARLNYTTLCAPLAVNLKLDKKLTSESDNISPLRNLHETRRTSAPARLPLGRRPQGRCRFTRKNGAISASE